MQPPRIDERDSRDLAAQLRRLVLHHAPDSLSNPDATQMNEAMIQVFARFGEIVIDRLNQVPGKNFLAFLQLLGFANLPPRAAKVPLTFYLAPGAEIAVIPARTQVAAQQLAGEKDPVIFETDQELVAVANRLTALFVKDGVNGFYTDRSRLLPQMPGAMAQPSVAAPLVPAFQGETPIPHAFYVALALESPATMMDRVMLKLGIRQADTVKERPSVEWKLFVPPTKPAQQQQSPPSPRALPATNPPSDLVSARIAHDPTGDTTEGLTKSGEIAFVNVPAASSEPCWLVCRLLTPVTSDEHSEDKASAPVLHASNLPVIQSFIGSVEIDRSGLALQLALFNNGPLDLSKDFYPLGEKPKFGDTLYLASKELFSTQDTTVVLSIEMTNPANAQGETPVPKVLAHAVKLAWEFWDGQRWAELGVSQEAAVVRLVSPEGLPASQKTFKDTTSAFTIDGEVTLTFPAPPVSTTIAGQLNFWVRVRLVAGNYGQEAHRQKELVGSEAVPANFAPPMIRSIKGAYSYRRNLNPQSLLAYNDFAWNELSPDSLAESTGATVQPFQAVGADEAAPALYFGFDPPASRAPVNSTSPSSGQSAPHSSIPVSMYVDAEESGTGISGASPSESGQLKWEYWSGQSWTALKVRDDSHGLRQPGLIRFVAPTDMVAASRFGCTRYWMRAVPSACRESARIRAALLNTVMATGSITYLNEDLGVSNGTPQQNFALLHKPVLTGQRMEVLEPHLPTHAGLEAIQAEEGGDSIRFAPEGNADTRVWVRWHQVQDFAASGPHDRHYLLDWLNGSIQFGDGLQGRIPPRGAKVRAATYRSGGGTVGNRSTGNITQLKTAIPSVTSACNWLLADSGGDAEADGALLDRGPRSVRHGERAVTTQDYEDLSRLASPEVARARCVPLRDLATDPGGKQHKPGTVSVIIAPRTDAPRPMPSLQLLECVLGYLGRFSPPEVRISAVAPSYIRVDVTSEVVTGNPDGLYEVEAAIRAGLSAYLHPLTGGKEGSGWPFGAMPQKSDFYALIASIPGVSYVRSVEAFTVADHTGIEHTKRFLITPGNIDVSLTVGEEMLAAEGGMRCR